MLLGDDVVAELDALVADVDRRPCDELAHLALGLAAERAAQVDGVLLLHPFRPPGQAALTDTRRLQHRPRCPRHPRRCRENGPLVQYKSRVPGTADGRSLTSSAGLLHEAGASRSVRAPRTRG